MKYLSLLLALALLVPCAAAAESPVDTAFAAVTEQFPSLSAEIRDQPEYLYGQAIHLAGEENGKKFEIFFVFTAEDTVECVFFGDPETYTVPESRKGSALVFLNRLNAANLYPTLYLADMGYPAGFASAVLPAGDDAALVSFVRRSVLGAVQAMQMIAFCQDFGAPEATTTPAPTPEARPTDNTQWRMQTVYRDQICPICFGSGDCTLCQGTGTYRRYGVSVPCDKECSYCGGTGSVPILVTEWVPVDP